MAEGVSEAAGAYLSAYTRSIIRGSTRGTPVLLPVLLRYRPMVRTPIPGPDATDYACALCVVSFSEP